MASPSPSPRRQPNLRYGNDQEDFYQISLNNDDDPAPLQPQKRRPQSSFLGGSRYDYANPGDSGNAGTGSLRPVQQYHNGFSGTDTDAKTEAAQQPAAAASPFATFSSASRAFLEHRRQQSIPNILPSFASSLTRSFSRAISPERQTRQARPGIPDFKPYNNQSDKPAATDEDNDDDDDDDSETSESELSESEVSDSEDSEDDQDSRRFTGDRRSRQINTQPTGTRGASESPSLKTNFASWLANSNTKGTQSPRVGSPTRRLFAPSPTPSERSLFTTRGGGGAESPQSETARRRLSYASDAMATPRSAVLAPAASTTTAASRLSQLTTSMTATLSRLTQPQQQQQQQYQQRAGHQGRPYDYDNDEFYHMDIEAALFPSGQPEDHDAFSPSAFKNLEANAVRTLRQLQAAYQQRTTALWDLAAEKSARDEDFDEAETRVQHLKMQLAGMAHKAAEQQRDMEVLREELAEERRARAHERAMLVGGYHQDHHLRDDDQMTTGTTTACSEDLGVEEAQRAAQKTRRGHGDPQHRRRKSSDADTDEEDEEDGSASSVFSRSRSPTMMTQAGGGMGLDGHTAYHPRVAALGHGNNSSSSSSSRPSSPSTAGAGGLGKFQKLVKNVTAALKDEDGSEYGGPGCRNCRGQDASFAWNTVGVLRDENKQLKLRVGQLEVAVEGALDMVNGVGLY